MLANLTEWLLSFGSSRHKLIHSARVRHEMYGRKHGINIEKITADQRRSAAASEELREVESLYIHSLQLTLADGDKKNVAIVHQQLGLLYYMWGDLERSVQAYSDSLSILEDQPQQKLESLTAISTCHYFLALISLEKEQRSTGREHILKALEIDELLNNQSSIQMDKRILTRCG
jgi:tetratricopeptide (TPR) repeat protein